MSAEKEDILVYSIQEVADLLGISRSYAYELVRNGTIPAVPLIMMKIISGIMFMEKHRQKPKSTRLLLMQDWVKEFLEKYKKNELKVTTYSSYMYIYRNFIEDSELGKMPLEQINTEILQKYYNEKIKEGYNSKTVREIGTIINSAFSMAIKIKMLSENPNLYTSIPKKVKYEAKVLCKEEVDRIISEAKEEELYPIIVVTIYTGMRKGEVMALKWENVDFEERKIYIKNSLCRVEDEQPDEKADGIADMKFWNQRPKKVSVQSLCWMKSMML